MRGSLITVAIAAAVVAGCSLLLSFDPNGLPCDAQGKCLAGYACVNQRCIHSTATNSCGGCGPGQRCRVGSTSSTCVPDTCAFRICPVGSSCVSDGGTACVPVRSPGEGQACATDNDCIAPKLCFKGLIPRGAKFGTCLEPCPGQICSTPGTQCVTQRLALDAGTTSVCLSGGQPTPCRSDDDCAADGLVCAAFDHPTGGPLTLCDSPQPGASVGEACGRTADGGSCADGLCLPQVGSGAAHCSTPCNETSCVTGQCVLAEIAVVPGVTRLMPMCGAPALCTTCANQPWVCGLDGPLCSPLAFQNACVTDCAADGGIQCAPNYHCQILSSGDFRCVPVGNTCP